MTEHRLLPYALVAPALAILAIAVAYPIGFNLFASVHRWNMLESDGPGAFVGLSTLSGILLEPRFWHSVRITLLITVLAVALEFGIGLGLAVLVNEEIHASRVLRAVLVAPIMATPLVVALIFRLMFHGEFGVVNWGLSLASIAPVNWLSQPATAILAVIVTEVWHNTSFVFLVLLGALQMLPREPYEAATIDGASALQKFRFLTLPMLKPAILVALLFRTVFAIRIFDEIWVLTKGGPQNATETISLLLYKSAFEVFDVAHAAGLSIVLLIMTSALALLMIRTLYRREPS
jgi:multiple sugar transport system permease protein